MLSLAKPNQLQSRHFLFAVMLITAAGTLLRFININYASLWPDELYSVLAVRPGNSWYEILYMQRAYQPPGYFMLLWIWTKLFAFNEFYARLLSVVGGAMSILISAFLGKTVKNARLGIVMALIVAMNPIQIWYSLEARFYVFVYFLAALSILLYWHLRNEKPQSVWLYLFKGGVDAALCYFHHFGMVFVFGQALFDLLLWRRDKNNAFLLKMYLGYVFAGILYAPWIAWGLTEGLAVKQYWLQETNILQFLQFNFGYSTPLTYFGLLLTAWFVFESVRRKIIIYLLFPFLILVVTMVPVGYSLIRFPILVDRYAMVLGPLFYLMLAMAMLWIAEKFQAGFLQRFAFVFLPILVACFCFSGLYLSVFDKRPLVKQPWREMAKWIKAQPDYLEIPVYALGTQVKGQSNIDFYLTGGKLAKHMNTLVPGTDRKMYLVETSGIWKINDSILHRVDSFYTRERIEFKEHFPGYGNIYICERKQLSPFAYQDSITQMQVQWTAQ